MKRLLPLGVYISKAVADIQQWLSLITTKGEDMKKFTSMK